MYRLEERLKQPRALWYFDENLVLSIRKSKFNFPLSHVYWVNSRQPLSKPNPSPQGYCEDKRELMGLMCVILSGLEKNMIKVHSVLCLF